MSWKPSEIMLTASVTPEKARSACASEARAGRLVAVCSVCLSESAALAAAVEGATNLSHGYCRPHFEEAMSALPTHIP